MKDNSTPTPKTAHDRFVELGKKVMAVPKADVAALEKKWQSRKPRRKRA